MVLFVRVSLSLEKEDVDRTIVGELKKCGLTPKIGTYILDLFMSPIRWGKAT